MYEIIYLPIAKKDIIDIATYITDHLKAPKAAMDLWKPWINQYPGLKNLAGIKFVRSDSTRYFVLEDW